MTARFSLLYGGRRQGITEARKRAIARLMQHLKPGEKIMICHVDNDPTIITRNANAIEAAPRQIESGKK